jgi:polysaccharide pyruvyl transferase WcaK-like protein
MNCCDLLVMRDEDSLHLAREIGVNKPIELAGDMAFLNQVSSRERATQILIDLGITPDSQILGLNVTSYFDSWLPTDKRISSADSFLNSMAEGINDAVSKITSSSPTGTKIDKIIFSCSPMDEEVTAKLAAKVGAKVVANSKYLSHDIQAVMRECGILVGMRFHSIVLSSAVGVPVVGLIYMPKVKSYFSLYGTPDLTLELKDVTSSTLSAIITRAWRERTAIRTAQQRTVANLRQTAEESIASICEHYFGEVETVAAPNRAAV